MIAMDDRFAFCAQVDDDNRLKSLMWTTGRSRSLYNHFGDAITFDTTYGTNIYKMPFGMFVGVSNHFESVIFAGVFLTNEKEENFCWAFKQFVAMMGGKHPVTILTDQARAIGNAVRKVFTHAEHRWCKWHVLKRAHELLGAVYSKHKTFADDFHKLVNHMLTVEEFESAWNFFTVKYCLQEHPFMTRAYECRHKWAKPYFSKVFCARMCSTQRSECANFMLKIHTVCNSSINAFITQYTKLIDDRESCDADAERKNKQKIIKVHFGYPMEKHALVIYTAKVYNLFKKELIKSTSYLVLPSNEEHTFVVKHVQGESRESWSKVIYKIKVDESIGYYTCECGLYEHFGVLCSHVLAIFVNRGVCKIPDCHIMKRWTKQARSSSFNNKLEKYIGDTNEESRSFRHKLLYFAAIDIVNEAENDQDAFAIAKSNFTRCKKELHEHRLSKTTTCQVGYGSIPEHELTTHSGVQQEINEVADSGLQIVDTANNISIPVSSILAPAIMKKNGRPSNKRYMSSMEANIKKKKRGKTPDQKTKNPGGVLGVVQSRFCSKCRSPTHTIKNCPQLFLP
ncbi:hypothetical protein ACQJBY_018202 [Aegilops geniculata]